jgi:hypothetical protein
VLLFSNQKIDCFSRSQSDPALSRHPPPLRRFAVTRVFCWKLVVFATLFLTLPSSYELRAQDTSASLTGTVADASGAMVPSANIELVNPATGQSYKAITNANGSYTIGNITPGPGYTETVSRQGFQKTVLTGLYLNVASTRTQNVTLTVGAVTETVAVSASNQDVTLDTTDATVGNNF